MSERNPEFSIASKNNNNQECDFLNPKRYVDVD
jgi:hypothetical protein